MTTHRPIFGKRRSFPAPAAAAMVALGLVGGSVVAIAGPLSAAPVGNGSLAGVVMAAGTPAVGVCVDLYGETEPLDLGTTTGVGGAYQFSAVPAGNYKVFFDPGCQGTVGTPYAGQYFDNVIDAGAATAVSVSAGQGTSAIDAALQLAGTVAGTVSGGGAGLQGVCVIAYSSSDGYKVESTTSGVSGSYSLALPPGAYLLQFDPTCRAVNSFAPEFYNGAPDAFAAAQAPDDVVSVASGSKMTANATLVAGSTLQGTVVASGGVNSGGICVFAYDAGAYQVGSAVTAADGSYDITDLPAQSYQVRFDPTCGGDQASDFSPIVVGTVSLAVGQVQTVSGSVEVTSCAQVPAVTTTALPEGTALSPYSASLVASGGTSSYLWSVSGLPTWLNLNPATGSLSGTAPGPGTFTLTVNATDSSVPPVASAPVSLSLTLAAATTSTLASSSSSTSSTAPVPPSSTTTAASTTTTVPRPLPDCAGNPGGGGPGGGSPGGGSGGGAPVTSSTTTTSSTTPSSTTTTVTKTVTAGSSGLPLFPPGTPVGAYSSPVTAVVAEGPIVLADKGGGAIAQVSVPAGAFPSGTTVSLAAVHNVALLTGEVPGGQAYVASFAVSWALAGGGSPAASHPLTMTITDASIRLGDVVYVLLGGRVQPVGQAVQNGSVTVSFSTDPDFIVAAVPHLAVVGANAVVVGTSVRVTLTCAAIAPCSGTARLSVRMPNGRWQWVAQAGPGRFALGAGSTGALRLTLTPSSRLLLAKAKASHEALVGRLVLSLRGGPPSVHPVSLRQ